jgi:hypothetical protein
MAGADRRAMDGLVVAVGRRLSRERSWAMGNEIHDPNLEKEKLQIEREKLKLEQEKTNLEYSKARWTAGSIIVSVVAAAGTIGFGLWSTYKQAESQFQVEVAKSIMQGTTTYDMAGRLEFYKRIFPGRLPPTFAQSPTKVESEDSLILAGKKEFFRTVVSREMSPTQALDLWVALFPGDKWPKFDNVAAALRRAESQSATRANKPRADSGNAAEWR